MTEKSKQQYSFFEQNDPFMLKAIESYESYIFKCWRSGLKTSKIIENWHKPITVEDVQIGFKIVLERHFKLFM